MYTYFAQTGSRHRFGGLAQCIDWVNRQVDENQSRIIRVSRIRAGERQASLIAEVTSDGVRFLDGRLKSNTSPIRRIARNGR